ncbi:MAG: C25 family cysteine peptidase [Chloroflexota bacterium]|jgi:hypothetical protein
MPEATTDAPNNPYVGPRSFTRAEGKRFYGRDKEARELLSLVVSQRLVLFYAPTGAGKSSLINARLVPDLESRGFFVLPVARVSGDLPPDIDRVENIYLFNLMRSLDQASAPKRLDGLSLPLFLAGLSSDDGEKFYFDDSVLETSETAGSGESAPASSGPNYVLIVDQFEELLTAHVDKWRHRIPFFEALDEAIAHDLHLWVILTLREDYIAALEQYEYLLADRMRARYYMGRMEERAALEAIKKPAEEWGRPFEPGVAEILVDNLREVQGVGRERIQLGQFIEPVHLQVVCRQLWENVLKKGRSTIGKDDLEQAGDVDSALGAFYEQVVLQVIKETTGASEMTLRQWVERRLITDAETRAIVYQGDKTTAGLPNKQVRLLSESLLLRDEIRSGRTWYELSHDRLIKPILRANQVWWLGQGDLERTAKAWEDSGRLPAKLQLDQGLQDRIATIDADSLDPFLAEFVGEARRLADEAAGREQALMRDFSTTGWGVIFARDADPALQEALQELLDWRQEQAGERFRLFRQEDGHRPGERADQFLQRHGADIGRLDLDLVPYYLLIVGSPNEIPFDFQYQLARTYAVGRLYFDHLGEYAQYAHNVVAAESRLMRLPKRANLFSPTHDNDMATRRVAERFVEPFAAALKETHGDWQIQADIGEQATKARLGELLGEGKAASFLFTSGHGLMFSLGNDQQEAFQGAVVCADWPGPVKGSGALQPEHYFAAADVTDAATLLGAIVFMFGEFTAGTPHKENFARRQGREARELARQPFLARLPQRLLSLPEGGALAVIGHIDNAWMYSWTGLSGQARRDSRRNIFMQFSKRLFAGHPVGSALGDFGQQYQELASIWADMELRSLSGEDVDRLEHVNVETAMVDIRNYIIIGDPAVRLMTDDEEEEEEAGALPEAPARITVAPVTATQGLKFHPDDILSEWWRPSGESILTLCGDGMYRLWEVNGTGFKTLEALSRSRPTFARWSPDGQRIATVDRKGGVSLWRADSGELERTLAGLWQPAGHVDWHPDGKMMAISGLYSAALSIVDADSGDLANELEGDVFAVRWSCWSPAQDRQILAVEETGRLRLWDSSDNSLLATIGEDLGQEILVAWSPSARYLAFSSDVQRRGTFLARIWDTQAGEVSQLLREHDHPIVAMSWFPGDDLRLMTLDNAGQLRLWHAGKGELLASQRVSADSDEKIAVSQHGKIALVDNQAVLVLETNDLDEFFKAEKGQFESWTAFRGPYVSAAWSPANASQLMLVRGRAVRANMHKPTLVRGRALRITEPEVAKQAI